MNINTDIVARAMDKAGQEPLTSEELAAKTGTRWRVIKDFYLSIILEALSNTAWTSQKKRASLELSYKESFPQPESDNFDEKTYYTYDEDTKTYTKAEEYSDDTTYYELNDNLTRYRYMYELPLACAKPVALSDDGEYMVEDGRLYTDRANAILMYVSNGFTGEEYEGEDYNYYTDPKLDPQLSAYIETKLAANIVLKLTGNMQLYQLLYTEASLMENRAIKASVAQGHSKDKGDRWWGDILGLPDYGDMN